MQYSDFSTAAFYANPYPFYDEMRAAGAIVKLAPGLFVTGRYSIVDKLLVDRRLGKGIEASARARYGDDVIDQPLFRLARQMLLGMNPPKHTRLRSLLMRAFNARQIEKFRQISHDISNRLVDALAPARHGDLISDFAFLLPTQIICTILDVPLQDAPLFKQAGDDVTGVLDPNDLRSPTSPRSNCNVTSPRYSKHAGSIPAMIWSRR